MKKVLGLVVSERQFGNSEILLKEIIKNIPEPCTKELIRLTRLNIEPCKACYQCLQSETLCKINDDFNFVFNKITEADALLIGVPVYFLGTHAQLHMLLHRMLGAFKYTGFTRNNPCIIVIPYGKTGWQGYSKSAALLLPRLLEMKIIDCWQVCATLPGESILTKDNLEYAKNLGQNIFSGDEYQKGTYECSTCGSDLFRLLPGREVECPLCGSRAFLNQDNIPDFSGADSHRFTTENLQKHFKSWLIDMKERFKEEKDNIKEVQKPYKEINWWVEPENKRKGDN